MAFRRVGHIYRINADGTGQVQLTYGERGETSPRWSPDGRRIAFLSRRGDDAHTQLYALAAEGGEARRVMAHPTAPSDITWAPDSRLVFFTAPLALSPAAAEKTRLQDDVFAFEETNFAHEHLWVVDLDGKTTRLTYGDYSVTDYTLSPSGSNALRLTTNEVAESEPLVSPDGTQVLFTAAANDPFESYYNDKLFVVPVGGGAARVLLANAPYQVTSAQWTPDGTAVVFVANHGVHTQVMQVHVASGCVTTLTSGDHTVGAWRMDPAARATATRSCATW